MFLIDVFRLGKESKVGTNAKLRLIKVCVANSSSRTVILRKAKFLKDSAKFKNVFVHPSHTVERSHIRGLYDIMRMKLEWITTLIGVALFHSGQ